jgi:hypothetical protein
MDLLPQPPPAPLTPAAPAAAAPAAGPPDPAAQEIKGLRDQLRISEKHAASLEARLAALEKLVPEILPAAARDIRTVAAMATALDTPPEDVDPLSRVLIGEFTTTGGPGWKEKTLISNAGAGMLADFGSVGPDGRGCFSDVDAFALQVKMADTQFVSLEVEDLNHHFYLLIPNPSFAVYLTQVGGLNAAADGSTFATYTYDAYLDAGKTIRVASAVSVEFHREIPLPVTPAQHGIMQWNGSTPRLLKVDEYYSVCSGDFADTGFFNFGGN